LLLSARLLSLTWLTMVNELPYDICYGDFRIYVVALALFAHQKFVRHVFRKFMNRCVGCQPVV